MEPQAEPVIDPHRVTDDDHRRVEEEMAMRIRPSTRQSYVRYRKTIVRFLQQYAEFQPLAIGEADLDLDRIAEHYASLDASSYGPLPPGPLLTTRTI